MKLFDQPLLLLLELLWCPDLHTHVKVADTAGVHAREAAAAEDEDLAALGAGGKAEGQWAGDTRRVHICAEDYLRIRDKHLAVEILTLPLEPVIFEHVEDHDHIATRAAAHTCVPDSAQMHVLPARDAGGHLQFDLVLAALPSLTAA